MKSILQSPVRFILFGWSIRKELLAAVEERDKLKDSIATVQAEANLLKSTLAQTREAQQKTHGHVRKLLGFIAASRRIDEPSQAGTIRGILTRQGLVIILFFMSLSCFGQAIQRQRWTTNTAPDSVVIAGVNTTVTTNVLAGGRVTFTIDSAGGPGGSQTNLALVVGGTNAYVHSATNLGVTTFTVDGPALRTQWSVGDITNAGTAAYSNAAAFDLSGTALNATNDLYTTLSSQITGSTNTTTLTTQLGLGTAAYSNTAAFLLKAGDTATGPLLSSSASITTPASTELATAGWVRSLFNAGAFFYTTTNVFANATNVGSDQFVYEFSTNIPLPAVRSWTTADFLTNNGYIGSVLVTNPIQQLSGQISVSAYLGFTGGASTPTLTLHPEVYLSYDRTNWFGDYSAGNQNIVHGSTNLYQWVIDFPAQVSTNATGFWIQRRFKVGAVTGTGTRTLWVMVGTNAISGTADASHISVNLPNGTINSTKSIYVADISTNQLPFSAITNHPIFTGYTATTVPSGGWSVNQTVRYVPTIGSGGANGTEYLMQSVVPITCTFTNMYVRESALGANTNATWTLMTNGVASNMTCSTIGVGGSTIVQSSDTSHGVPIAAGTLVSVKVVGDNTSAGVISAGSIVIQYYY